MADDAGPRLDFPNRRLPDLVADHARRRPDAIAVRQWDATLTYGEVVAGAGAVAGAVLARGAGPLVGLCVERHPDLVTGLLGVLAAGAGYVPLDPGQPVARLRGIAAAAGLRTVVCDAAGADLLAGAGLDLLPLSGAAGTPPPVVSTMDGVAYTMFTSGSTGTPKGVLIGHRALTEFVTGLASIAGLGP